MKLFWKILIVYFLAWALLTAGLFAVLILDLQTEFIPRSPISQNLPSAVGVQIAGSNLRLGDEQAFRKLAKVWTRGQPPYVVGEGGTELLGRDLDPALLELAESLAQVSDQPVPVKRLEALTGKSYLIFYPQGTGPEDRTPRRLLFEWPWLIAVFFAAAGLMVAAGLSASWTRPLSALERSFDRFTEGDLEVDLSPAVRGRRDEIGDLVRHFEGMASRLASSIAAQRRLLHDISHELRSPLARLGVAVELARRRPGETDIALERIERECSRLDRLIQEVLTLARLENDASAERAAGGDEYFDLLELLRTIHDDVAFEAEAVGMRVALELPERDELILRGRAELLHRAVENVVRNALKHAVGADLIELRLDLPTESADRSLRISVKDDGEALPDDDLSSFFDAFRHGKSSAGFGLGLAIAKRAVALHRGEIRAEARPTGGVEVTIELPHSL